MRYIVRTRRPLFISLSLALLMLLSVLIAMKPVSGQGGAGRAGQPSPARGANKPAPPKQGVKPRAGNRASGGQALLQTIKQLGELVAEYGQVTYVEAEVDTHVISQTITQPDRCTVAHKNSWSVKGKREESGEVTTIFDLDEIDPEQLAVTRQLAVYDEQLGRKYVKPSFITLHVNTRGESETMRQINEQRELTTSFFVIYFMDEKIANRAADLIEKAVRLCRGR